MASRVRDVRPSIAHIWSPGQLRNYVPFPRFEDSERSVYIAAVPCGVDGRPPLVAFVIVRHPMGDPTSSFAGGRWEVGRGRWGVSGG